MTCTVLLIRHAAHGHLGKVLSGRLPGLALSEEGRDQARRLARALASVPIDALHASPVQRARETAEAIAGEHSGRAVEDVAALDEIDFGSWAGRAFADLCGDPAWNTWNARRASATAPGGESMAAAQARAWAHVESATAAYPDGTVAMISHCDIIRALVARVLGLSLDAILRFDVDPASVTRLAVAVGETRLLSLNERYP